jgi:hypothetical protein
LESLDESREEDRPICAIQSGGVETTKLFGSEERKYEWQEIAREGKKGTLRQELLAFHFLRNQN